MPDCLYGSCSARDEDEWETEASSAEEHEEPSEAVWAFFWGWDCYGPGGILDRIFTALKIPDRSWSVRAKTTICSMAPTDLLSTT